MAHDVFICHAHADLNTALAACAKLEEAGVRCWIAPRDVDAGPYAGQLVRAIETASAVLLIFSDKANGSEHVLRELEIASKNQKVIIPFRIEDVPPNEDLQYFTMRVHWLDDLGPPMETRLAELVAFVQRLLAAHPALTPVASEAAATPAEPRTHATATVEQTRARPPRPWWRTPAAGIGGALAVLLIVLFIAFRQLAPHPEPARQALDASSTAESGFGERCPMHGSTDSDDFAHDTHRWGTIPSEVSIGGGYLTIRPAKEAARPLFFDGQYRDAAICTTVEVSTTPTSHDSTAGLVFWDETAADQTDDFYAFEVNQRQEYWVGHLSHHKWTLVVALSTSKAIKSYTDRSASNVLAIRTAGHTVSLYVNGTNVGTVNGKPPALWLAGLIGEAGLSEQHDITWRFHTYALSTNPR